MRTRLFLLIGVLAMLIPAAGANANTVQVTTTVDSPGPGCTLRDAVDVVPMGGTTLNDCTSVVTGGINRISFAGSLTGQTIELSNGELPISAPVTDLSIEGPGMNDLSISATSGERALALGAGVIDISGLTVRDGEGGTIGPGSDRGGCIRATNTQLNLTDVRLTNCSSVVNGGVDMFADGGGVASSGSLTIVDSLIDGNTVEATNTAGDPTSSSARGAGIWTDTGANLRLIDSVVRSNTATATDDETGTALAAGGVFSADDVEISGSTISGNTGTATQSDADGGTAWTAGGVLLGDGGSTIELSTIAGNIGDANSDAGITYHGGGINTQAEELEIRSSTIALNGPTTGTLDGVNLFVLGGGGTTTNVTNTILADPRGGGLNCLNLIGPLTSGGFNVDYTPAPGGGTCFALPAATDLATDPLLSTAGLANNGGGTETIALQAASPAIDKGSNAADDDPDFDQRGLPRPVDFTGLTDAVGGNGTDIGAFELQLACAGQATPVASCGGGNTPVTPVTPAQPTGKRAKALKKCKKIKNKKKRNKCKKKANKQPV